MNLRYNPMMLKIQVYGDTSILLGTNNVCMKTSTLEYKIKKNAATFLYHVVHWAVAAKELRVWFEKSKDNPYDNI